MTGHKLFAASGVCAANGMDFKMPWTVTCSWLKRTTNNDARKMNGISNEAGMKRLQRL